MSKILFSCQPLTFIATIWLELQPFLWKKQLVCRAPFWDIASCEKIASCKTGYHHGFAGVDKCCKIAEQGLKKVQNWSLKEIAPSLILEANIRVAWYIAAADHLSGAIMSSMSSQFVSRGNSLNVWTLKFKIEHQWNIYVISRTAEESSNLMFA